jgi:exosortase
MDGASDLPLWGTFLLWAPAMLAASYVWGHGEYYDYGWFVPPASIILTWRRWRDASVLPARALRPRTIWLAALLLLPWIWVLRVLGYVDPSWRMPISLLGATAAIVSHAWLGATRGWRFSGSFFLITLLWLSALPWPSVVESGIVHHLTAGVIGAVAKFFHFLGEPVEILGDRLRLHGETVEVTDGCSGVRSFQSFVMATWFFAELQRLKAARTLALLACACGIAFLVNMARTFTLAEIRFTSGQAAFDRAHDWLGLLAFFVSGIAFFAISAKLSEPLPALAR